MKICGHDDEISLKLMNVEHNERLALNAGLFYTSKLQKLPSHTGLKAQSNQLRAHHYSPSKHRVPAQFVWYRGFNL